MKRLFPHDSSTFSVKIDAVTHMFLKDNFTGKSSNTPRFWDYLQVSLFGIILEGLVRWAGAQPKPELHLQSRFCPSSSGKWQMLHCHFSLFGEGESLSSTWKYPRSLTKVKPTARIYIHVLVLPHNFRYLYKTRGFIPVFFFLKKLYVLFCIKP